MSSVRIDYGESHQSLYADVSEKSIAEKMGFERVQLCNSDKNRAKAQPKVKKKKGLEQIMEPQKDVNDRSIHFSDNSTAVDAYLSKMKRRELKLGELVNELVNPGGDIASEIKKYLKTKDLLNLTYLTKASLKEGKLLLVLTDKELFALDSEKIEFAKKYNLKIKLKISRFYNQFTVFRNAFIESKRDEHILTNVEVLDFEHIMEQEDFGKWFDVCPNITSFRCGSCYSNITFNGMSSLVSVFLEKVGARAKIIFRELPNLVSISFKNLDVNVTLEELPQLADLRSGGLYCAQPFTFIGEFPSLRSFSCGPFNFYKKPIITFPKQLNSVTSLSFGEMAHDAIIFPEELNALEKLSFSVMYDGVTRINLPPLPNLKQIIHDRAPDNILKMFKDLQVQIDAREKGLS